MNNSGTLKNINVHERLKNNSVLCTCLDDDVCLERTVFSFCVTGFVFSTTPWCVQETAESTSEKVNILRGSVYFQYDFVVAENKSTTKPIHTIITVLWSVQRSLRRSKRTNDRQREHTTAFYAIWLCGRGAARVVRKRDTRDRGRHDVTCTGCVESSRETFKSIVIVVLAGRMRWRVDTSPCRTSTISCRTVRIATWRRRRRRSSVLARIDVDGGPRREDAFLS